MVPAPSRSNPAEDFERPHRSEIAPTAVDVTDPAKGVGGYAAAKKFLQEIVALITNCDDRTLEGDRSHREFGMRRADGEAR